MRTLDLPEKVPANLMAIAPQSGTLVFFSSQDFAIHSYTINARHVESAGSSEKVLSMAISPDGRYILTGGAKGLITLRYLHSLQVRLLSPLSSCPRD